MDAYLKAEELKNEKVVDYCSVQEKGAPIGSPPATATKTRTTTSQTVKSTPEVSPPEKEKIPPPEQPVKETSMKTTASKSSGETQTSKTKKKKSKKASGLSKGGYGRNMEGGTVALGFRYIYQEVEPDLTKRTLTMSDGTTTTTQNIPITGTEIERNTSMHIPSLYFRWGLANWLEVFGGGGVAYDEYSDVNPAYGGGLRLNLFDFKGFYGALQGEYGVGTVEYEYDAVNGSKWHKKAEWTEIFAKGELGLARNSFSLYLGGSYLNYQEETERRLLSNIPAPYTSYVFNDELEEKSFGAFGGVVFNLSNSFFLSIEGQGINKKGVFGSLEYQF